MIPGLKDLKYEDRLWELNLWTLEDRKVRAGLIKIVRGLSFIKAETFCIGQQKSNKRTSIETKEETM